MSKYNVTKEGVVTNAKTGRVMKAFKCNGKWVTKAHGTNYYTHRMMWEQYFGPVFRDEVVMFKDDNPDNLSLDNLYKTDRFAAYDRTNEDFPYCYSEQGGVHWKRFICKYKGKILASSNKADWDDYKERHNFNYHMEHFYDFKAIHALKRVIPNRVAPLWGFEDLYDVHSNSGVTAGNENSGVAVLHNKKTGRWTSYASNGGDGRVKIVDHNGKSVNINILKYVWNSFNPNNLAEEVKFRSPQEGLFFDLIKVR